MLPVLETPRLILRSFTPDDAAAVSELAADSRVADMTLNIPHPYDQRMAEEWISTHATHLANGEQVVFAVTLKTSHSLIGAVSLGIDQPFNRANLGYWVGVPWWNQGYGTEAARAVVDFGFAEFKLHRVHASH
ncbi:MAG: GNAT family N-acetyltransferase, partial [Woeseia sp.]